LIILSEKSIPVTLLFNFSSSKLYLPDPHPISNTELNFSSLSFDKAMSNLASRYEKELMNPEEALRLGSVSRLVMPGFSRKVLGNTLLYLLRHYQPSPMVGTQRE